MPMLYSIICIFTIFYAQNTIADFSFKKIYESIIPRKQQQQVSFEEYSAKDINLIPIKNKKGNITVKADGKNENIFLKVTKRSPDQEILPHLTFCQKVVGNEMIIESTYDDTLLDGSIDFELVIPTKVAISAATHDGNLYIKGSHAPTRARTQKGDIHISSAYNIVDAQVGTKGTITLANVHERVKAQTNYGNIIIHDAFASVFADATYGTIEMYTKDVLSTSTIKLATVSGSILLHLPPDVNADLQASTKRGTITCDHFITLKPKTTQLNKSAWKQLQKDIDGILGTGEAQIKLSSVRSNIKLLEMKA